MKRHDYKGRQVPQSKDQCGHKKRFTADEADRVAQKFNQKKYLCSNCGHWHMTNIRGEKNGH